MSKRDRKTRVTRTADIAAVACDTTTTTGETAVVVAPDTTPDTTGDTTPDTTGDTTPDTTGDTTPDTTPTRAMDVILPGTYRLTHAATGDVFTVPVTATIARIADAVSGIAPDASFGDVVTHVRNRWNANGPAVDFSAVPLNRSPWAGNVTESQNAMYCGIAVAGVPMSSARVVAVWRALLPVTKCEFETHERYGFSTFADFANGRHGAVPGVPAGTWAPMMSRWYVSGGIVHPDRWSVARVND